MAVPQVLVIALSFIFIGLDTDPISFLKCSLFSFLFRHLPGTEIMSDMAYKKLSKFHSF